MNRQARTCPVGLSLSFLIVTILVMSGCDRLKNKAEVVKTVSGAAVSTSATPTLPDYKGIQIPDLITTDIGPGTGETVTADSKIQVFISAWVYDPAAPNNRGPKVFETQGASEKFDMQQTEGLRGVIGKSLMGMRVGGKRRVIIPAEIAKDATVPEGAIVMVETSVVDPQNGPRKQ